MQNPLVLSDDTELYPDLMLLKPSPNDYRDALPTPADTLLVIEVADSSLIYDRSIKAPRYAAASVSELWVLDVEGKRLWVYRKHLEREYSEVFVAQDVLQPEGLELILRLEGLLSD